VINGPGCVVELPASEIRKLIDLGFLIDPDNPAPARPEEDAASAT
jgi:hypothetical protein